LKVFEAAKVPVEWESFEIHSKAVSADGDLISEEAINSVKANKVALKGPFMTPIGTGFKSLNVTLRRKLQLYANVRPCKTFDGL
jgi:isocitrate dehydrogenase (NAD+)